MIYETKKGELVRSKSELIIANLLFENDLDYRYEEEYKGKKVRGSMFPDFQFNLLDGEIIVWEHLGLLTEEAYNSQWQYKKEWYLKNGLISNETLFLSYEEDIQKSERLLLIIENIKSIIRNTSSE